MRARYLAVEVALVSGADGPGSHGIRFRTNASYIGGQSLASLVLRVDDYWTRLPFCSRTVPTLPPEPFRYAGGSIEVIGARVSEGFGERIKRLAETLEVTKGELPEMVVEHYELVRGTPSRDWRVTLQRRRTEYFGVRVRADVKRRCLGLIRELAVRREGGRHLGFGDLNEVMLGTYEAFRGRLERLPAGARARLCTSILMADRERGE